MKFALLLALLGSALAAGARPDNLFHRPRAFSTPAGRAVFVDFLTADYALVYDGAQRTAAVTATIRFVAAEAGLPVFDVVEAPTEVTLDGAAVSSQEVKTPGNETIVRVAQRVVAPGPHTLVVKVPLKTLVDFSDGGVRSAFWTSDLEDRRFLELYLPANLEFDQVKMSFTIAFLGAAKAQKIYTNGTVRGPHRIGDAEVFSITYPEYFTSSSLFFHTVPEGITDELRFSLKSVDGRDVPVVIYLNKSIFSSSLDQLRRRTTEIFHELEGDYGAWPHPSLVIYNAGSGGMEYCGATITSASALGHELFHSYFARGVMPANGNAGWVDEALASWRDAGYPSNTSMTGTSRMSSRAPYTRSTDMAAYSFGQRFVSYLDGILKEKGGLKPFMRQLVERRRFAPLFIEEYISRMSDFYGVPLEGEFKKFTFGGAALMRETPAESVIHRKLSLEELQRLL
jgi:hypothetical protein